MKWTAVAGLAALALASTRPAGGAPPAREESPAQDPSLPASLVADLHGAFGEHHARAVHSKGIVLRGHFIPDPGAASLSTASVFTATLPVIVRFSDFTGLPDIPDNSGDANPRGLAIKFPLPDGASFDVVSHSFNGFPVATSAEFGELLRAIAASGPAAPKPTPLDGFLASHPAARTFLTTQQSPESWATALYFGVNAFAFTNTGGITQHARYRFVPEAGLHVLSDASLRKRQPDYLAEDIRARVAEGPIRFDWYAQVAQAGDRIDDPSVAWPESRKLVRLGTLVVDRLGENTPAEDKALIFLPGDVPPGIAIADPMLSVRNAAYPVSFGERQ